MRKFLRDELEWIVAGLMVGSAVVTVMVMIQIALEVME